MSNPIMAIRPATLPNGGREISYWLWCPGCDEAHRITDLWEFNGDEAAPTFNPSILVHSHPTLNKAGEKVNTPQCHSFIAGGRWQFLSDCDHELASQTVPMVPLPDYLVKEAV